MNRAKHEFVALCVTNFRNLQVHSAIDDIYKPHGRNHRCCGAQQSGLRAIIASLTSRATTSASFRFSFSVRFATLPDIFKTTSDASRSNGNTAPLMSVCDPTCITRVAMRSHWLSERVAERSLIRAGSPPRTRSRARNDLSRTIALTSYRLITDVRSADMYARADALSFQPRRFR